MLLDLGKCSGPAQQCKVPLIFLVNTSSDVPAAVLKCPDHGDNSFIRGRTWFHLLLSGWFTELEMLLCFHFSSQWPPRLLMKCTFLGNFSLLFKVNETAGKQNYSVVFEANHGDPILQTEFITFFLKSGKGWDLSYPSDIMRQELPEGIFNK